LLGLRKKIANTLIMLVDDPRENRFAEWFRSLTMGVRIQLVMFSLVGIVLGVAVAISLIKEPAVLLPTITPDSKPVVGEPVREEAANTGREWREARLMMMGQDGKIAQTAESKGEIEAMRRMVALKPGEADGWDRLGKSLYLAKQYDEAVKAFRKALEINPKSGEILANLGVTLKTKGEMTEYEKTVQTLSLVDAKLAKSLMEFSPAVEGTTSSAGKGRPAAVISPEEQEAMQESGEVRALRKLVAMDPKDADSLDGLGKALYLKGNLKEAVECFEKALALKPGVEEVLANLGVALKTQGSTREYEKVLAKLAVVNPKTAEELKAFVPPPRQP
jgi:cytochrome c-type biogenesis protein CcmH/NrfG